MADDAAASQKIHSLEINRIPSCNFPCVPSPAADINNINLERKICFHTTREIGARNSPPAHVFEAFAKNIIELAQSNPEQWAETAIFVTVDEGGGYYDSGFSLPARSSRRRRQSPPATKSSKRPAEARAARTSASCRITI